MVKRIDKVRDLKVGDEIELFVISSGDKARTVAKKCFRVLESPFREREYLKFKCRKIREDGSYMRDSYGDVQDTTFLFDEKYVNYLRTHIDVYYGCQALCYYFEPFTPCEKIIKRLVQEKRKLNKYIVDCQNLMYKNE